MEVEALEGKGKKVINLHLGNGASLCAMLDGKSMDTSMGFTPLAGIMMGTRSGDVDPAISTYMMEQENISAAEFVDALNKKSGFLGVSGISSDSREIEDAVAAGNPDAIFTEALYVKRIADYIGSYIMTLGGVDVITFTAGIGENSAGTRKAVIDRISAATGAKIDTERNNVRGKTSLISTDDSAVKVYLIPTNEELMIAKDTQKLLNL
jgi:acetate kinase